MANHLKPNDPGYSNTEDDLLFSCRIMARALSFLLKENGLDLNEKNEGVVILLDGKTYIIFNNSETKQIDITEDEELKTLKEGTLLWVHQ